MISQLIKLGQFEKCPYCLSKISSRWESEFEFDLHYKSRVCESCNRKVHVRVNFHGSGNDTWKSGECKNINDLVLEH